MDKKTQATGILEKIKVLLGIGEIKLEQQTLADGVTVFEADVFESGNSVSIVTEEGVVPVPIGEYELSDGRMIVVTQEGVIDSIKEKATEQPPADQPTEMDKDKPEPPSSPQAKKIIESVIKETHLQEHEDLKVKFEALEKENSELKLKIQELEKASDTVELKEEPIKPISHNPEPKNSEPIFKISAGSENDPLGKALSMVYGN